MLTKTPLPKSTTLSAVWAFPNARSNSEASTMPPAAYPARPTSARLGIPAAAFYVSFRWPAINLALKIRRKWPDAPFDGLIVFYTILAVMGISIAVGIVAYRMVYRHAVGTTPGSKHIDLS